MPRLPGLLLTLLLTTPIAALENHLVDHPSPYLAMHGDDPVAWQDWGSAALELARREGKLLFLSSGYFACHWCHVMQRESYQNVEIAGLLNRHFVPVKIDRELHGALDSFLIEYVRRTQGQAGWPLNVFLTPEGYPLIGTTYQPPARFQKLLGRLQAHWRKDSGQLRDLAQRVSQKMMRNELGERAPNTLSSEALRESLLTQAMDLADRLAGGFGEQSKFPMAPQLLALLELQAARPKPQLAEFLVLTLDAMANGGLRDHLAGGFFRYTVDPAWEIPHFEKMLYTQALLSEVFLRAAEVLSRPDYAAVARDTLRFVIREMPGTHGGYVASFSAVDQAGREGGVYLWSSAQLEAALGERDSALARRYWGMQGQSALDAGYLPRRGASVVQTQVTTGLGQGGGRGEGEFDTRLTMIKEKLLATRGTRGLPVDHKQLAGWNGLLLAAFARAALAWDDPELRVAADRVRDFLRSRLWNGAELQRAVADRRILARATLDDYAYVAFGMAAYAKLSGDASDHDFARKMVGQAWQRYQGLGGWRLDDRSLLPGLGARAALPEGALPAPSAVLIRLAAESDDPNLVERAAAAAELGRSLAQSAPLMFAGHHIALLALSGQDSVDVGAGGGPPTRAVNAVP